MGRIYLPGRKPSASIHDATLLNLVNLPIVPPQRGMATMANVIDEADRLRNMLIADPHPTVIVEGAADLKKPGLKVIFGLQYPPKEYGPHELSALRARSIFFAPLAYEEASAYGGGFAKPEMELTKAGQFFLEDLTKAGMILDLSHAGYVTARNALAYIKKHHVNLPVVATHSGCRPIYRHPYNLPEDILVGIAGRGGVVGITTATFFLDDERNDLDPFRRHVKYAMSKIGPSSIVIGSAGIYRELDPKQDRRHFERMQKKFDPRGNFRSRWPTQPPELNCPDRMSILTRVLLYEFGVDITRKVVGQNLFDFLKRTLLALEEVWET